MDLGVAAVGFGGIWAAAVGFGGIWGQRWLGSIIYGFSILLKYPHCLLCGRQWNFGGWGHNGIFVGRNFSGCAP